MKEVEGKQLVECMICGVLVGSVYSYHKHNVRQHSLAQLSRAILKLRNLKLPLTDPTTSDSATDDEDDDDDDVCGRIKDPMTVLKLPVKVEAMDEVIELGPTDNSDHLQVQSRLFNSSDEVNQHSSQVIEVKENHHPPPTHFNPLVEDPNAITVKFGKELITAKDNTCPTMSLPDARKRVREGNKVLRATFKSTIDIPSPNSFITDYKKAMSHSSEKYIMQNIDRLAPLPPRKKKGRPRRNPENPQTDETTKSKVDSIGNEEEDVEFAVDPLLFSDEEDEEDHSVAIPAVAKTRSGRTVKMKKEDGTFRYYDMPGSSQLDAPDDLKSKRQWEDESYSVKKSRRGKRRKIIPAPNQNPSTSTESCDGIPSCSTSINIKEECSVSVEEEDIIQAKDPTRKGNVESLENEKENTSENVNILSKNKANINSDKDATVPPDTLNSFVCFMCLKEFATNEDCENHMQEHLSKVSSGSNEATSVNERLEHSEVDMVGIADVSTKGLDTSQLEDTPEKAPASTSSVGDAAEKGDSALLCSVCNDVFETQEALDDHSHDTAHDCQICGKKYQNRVNLQSHIKKYHEETEWMKFRCATCGQNFGFLLALERHMKEHNPNQKICCEQCGKVFKTLNNLKNHLPLHTKDEIFRCPYCPKQYYIRYSYDKHVRSHLYPPKFHCEVCNKYFNDKKYFEVHLERHQTGGCLGRSKDLRCNNCGDIKTPTELDIVSETNPGHHKTCLECGKGHYKKFMLENLDSASLQDKTERAREQCKLCGKFVINIVRHVKSRHLENPYVPCDVCGTVVSKSSLPSHKNRKHGGSAVTCDHCNKVFKNIMCLREHMTKVRKKEDPSRNICKFCKELVAPDLWKEHMARHRMQCSECGASEFGSQEEFMSHLEACRRCSNCGTNGFASQEDYLAHMEMCVSSIDIMTGTLDAASDQEVVTSIFAIVDESTCCGTCGEDFEDQIALANHITEVHPDTLQADHTLRETNINGEDVLYACPQETCGVICPSKELLSNHLTSIHNS